MARIFPTPLPEAVLKDPRRTAERKMYVELDKQLPQDVQVFYGVAWLARKREGDARDSEADFVLVEPNRGMLVIEVKGGRIARDGVTGTWTSNQIPIDDPIAQARNNRHALIDKIRSLPRWGNRWVRIGHAVAFPDCAAPARDLTPDLPQEIAICNEDLPWLDKKVGGIFDYWRAELGGPAALDAVAQKILRDALAPTFDLRQPLGSLLNEEDRQILRLTEQEFGLLDALIEDCISNRKIVRGGVYCVHATTGDGGGVGAAAAASDT
ncbi:MAG: nuclease-related domain-containing protein, partial [Candidatus Binatia bacterium]